MVKRIRASLFKSISRLVKVQTRSPLHMSNSQAEGTFFNFQLYNTTSGHVNVDTLKNGILTDAGITMGVVRGKFWIWKCKTKVRVWCALQRRGLRESISNFIISLSSNCQMSRIFVSSFATTHRNNCSGSIGFSILSKSESSEH